MSREHKGLARLHRGEFSGTWYAVLLAADGKTITDKWPLHADDAEALDALITSKHGAQQ